MARALGTRPRTAVWVALVAVVTGGCGGGGGARTTGSRSAPATSTTSSTSGTGSRSAPRRRPARPRGAPVGATQRVHAGSSTLAVAVTQVLDPLTGTGSVLLPGTRAVGVMVTVHNLAGATYDSTASGDWSLATTSGAASPLFVRRGVCQTPLVDFESLIGPGETRTGCVGFSVERGTRVTGVRFSPHSRAAGAVTWR